MCLGRYPPHGTTPDQTPGKESLAVPLPTPLERLQLPPDLSGAAGSNRAPATATRIAAADDLAAVTAWLARYADSAATLTAYRREVERLLLWTVLQLGKPLSSLTHEDLLVYERFLADPQPAARWVLAGSKKLGRAHPDWRPFAGPLSPASVRHALVILNALFAWLTEAGYLAGNPLALARRRRAPTQPRITRYLSHELWDAVKDAVAAMPGTTDPATARERLHAVRCRWLLSVLYLGGLRAAEVTGIAMGAFFCRRDAQGVERWWLEGHRQGQQDPAGAGHRRADRRTRALSSRPTGWRRPRTPARRARCCCR